MHMHASAGVLDAQCFCMGRLLPGTDAPTYTCVQISKGKCEGLQALAAALVEEASKVCLEEAEEYR